MEFSGPSLIDINKTLTFALDIGEEMLKCNAEISRVEDTLARICSLDNVKKIDVFAVKSLMIVTIRDQENNTFSQSRRIYSSSTDLEKLEALNGLSRYICEKRPSEKEVEEKLEEFKNKNFFSRKKNLLGYALSTAGFCIFFGGNINDVIATTIIAIMICYINAYIGDLFMNQIIFTAVSSILMGISAIILVKMGVGTNFDKIIIGDIMILIPGIHFVNSMRDMLSGDLLAGILRLLDVVLITLAIACGFAIAVATLGGII